MRPGARWRLAPAGPARRDNRAGADAKLIAGIDYLCADARLEERSQPVISDRID
jgi:hypothetical protein